MITKVLLRESETTLSLIKRFNRVSNSKKRLCRTKRYFIKPSKRSKFLK